MFTEQKPKRNKKILTKRIIYENIKIKNLFSVELIFLDKKCYIHEIVYGKINIKYKFI